MDIKPVATRLNNDLGTTQVNDNKASPTAKVETAHIAEKPDLSLTDTAKNLLDLQSNLEKLGDVDFAKVEAIRQAIEDGSYEVDSAQLADNLIKSSLELP